MREQCKVQAQSGRVSGNTHLYIGIYIRMWTTLLLALLSAGVEVERPRRAPHASSQHQRLAREQLRHSSLSARHQM